MWKIKWLNNNVEISNPVETEIKAMSSQTRVPTGSSSYTKTNNIYDISHYPMFT